MITGKCYDGTGWATWDLLESTVAVEEWCEYVLVGGAECPTVRANTRDEIRNDADGNVGEETETKEARTE